MIQKQRRLAVAALAAAAYIQLAHGQTPQPATLVVDLQNVVEYQSDISDAAKFATSPGVTPSAGFKNFAVATIIGDIVAVNGQPAKGLYAGRSRAIVANQNPSAGGAIADVNRVAMREHIFEILKANGATVGTIVSVGFSGGQVPPGLSTDERGNWAIVGGTGAFLGARGQLTQRFQALESIPARAASMAEDPANRRTNAGGTVRFFLRVIPMYVPQIVMDRSGPAAITHSDFTLVSGSKPAIGGEILSIFATGLGPTIPSADPGQPFPASPPAVVTAPIEVLVNGKPAEVLAAVGLPGYVDAYQVNFRMPPGNTNEAASVQLSAAWMSGAAVYIPVR